MNDSYYSKLFGLSLATVFAFVLAFHAIAHSNTSQPDASSQSDQLVRDLTAAQPCLASDRSCLSERGPLP
jgi:hypothetical protein